MALPPGFAWAATVPELYVSDLAVSLRFWCGLCGFTVAFDRPAEGFAYLDRDGCQVMLEQASAPGRKWVTGALELPFGRGVNFEFTVADLGSIQGALDRAGHPYFLPPEERCYRAGEIENGVRQFAVQDPDGYLVRFSQRIGQRPADGT